MRIIKYHYAAGQYEPAIADATRAIELDPQNAQYYYSRGVSYHAAGRPVERIQPAI